MTEAPGQGSKPDHVSRSRYERERRARTEAEELLESKSRELFEANRSLAREAEAARAALADAEAMRAREAVALKERSILLEALAALSGKTGAAQAMQALLECLKVQFEAAEASFIQASGGQVRITAAVPVSRVGSVFNLDADQIRRAQTLPDLIEGRGPGADPDHLHGPRSAILAPLSIPGEGPGALLLGREKERQFSDGELRLLERVCSIASQGLIALREARRNALLVGLIEGRSAAETDGGVLDAPLEAVHRAFARLTDMQGQVVSILDALLEAPIGDADQAIESALRRVARLIQTKRGYVYRMCPGRSALSCSHDWSAPGVDGIGTKVRSIPPAAIEDWRSEFDAGNEVMITDAGHLPGSSGPRDLLDSLGGGSLLAVPMMQDGRFHGFVGFDMGFEPRNYLSGEVHLVRSVAKVIVSVLVRRDNEEKLLASADDAAKARATLVSAVEALQDGFVLYDADDRLVICNERYREIYKRSAEAIVPGARFEDILRHGLDNGEYAEAIGREEEWLVERLANHRRSDNAIEQQLGDGRWLRIFEKATPDGGRVGLRVDITEIKLAETRALADRSAAMEASQDGIAITGADGRFLYMNRAHLEMFGYDDDAEIIGKPWSTLYAPAVARWMEASAFAELQRDGHWSGEVIGRGREGQTVDQDVSLTLQEDGGILCIVRDMSERRREAVERERLRDELQLAQRREIIGQLAAGLAHDFNNLLAAISGSAALIEADTPPDSAANVGLHRIQAAADQGAALVNRLLALGAREKNRLSIDFREHLREAADLIRASTRAPTRLDVDLPEMPILVDADPTDLLQVVLNLAINARDALKEQEGGITLSLAPALPDDLEGPFVIGGIDPSRQWLCLTVADTGPGIDPDALSQVFKPYFSTKGADGTGLGLAIVSSIVTSNGGAVSLETEPGKGTRFRVLWPTGTPSNIAASAAPGDLTGRLDGRSILVLDDQEDVLAVISAFLENAGAEVAPSSEPSDILEALREDPEIWDLLVTDFDMPELTGAEVARRAHAVRSDLPVILVTAFSGALGGSGAVFDAVLDKPIDREALVSAAETAILRRRSRG